MSRYRTVHCLLWNDDKFPFASDDCQLVFLHLLTTPLSSPFGLYKASMEALAAEKRWPFPRYAAAFAEAVQLGFVAYDERAQVIWIPNFLRYNGPGNLNVLKSWAKTFDEIPRSQLKDRFFRALESLCGRLSKAFADTFAKAFAKDWPTQEQEQEQEQTPPRMRAIDIEGDPIREGATAEMDPAVDRVRAAYVAALEARYGPAVAAEGAWAGPTRARVGALVAAHGEALVTQTVAGAVARWEEVAAATQGRLTLAPSIEALVGGFWRLFLVPRARGGAPGRDAGEYREPTAPLDVGWG